MNIEEAVNNVISLFESQNFPAEIALTTIKRISGEQEYPSDKYSLLNRLILMHHNDEIAMGYKAWNKFNRYVRKGSKSISIFAPCTKRIRADESKDGQEHIVITGFHTIPVFGLSATDGEPLNLPDYTPKELPPFIDVAKALGIKVNWRPESTNAYGWYSPGTNEVTLCSTDLITVVHELSHACHNRFENIAQLNTDYVECIGELSAAILCELCGVQGYHHQSYEYIKSYTKGKTHKETLVAINKVLSMVEKITHLIIDTAESLKLQPALENS